MCTLTKDDMHTAEDHWEIDRWRSNNWWCIGGLMQRNKPSTPVCCTSLIFQRLSTLVIKSCNIIHCHGETNEKYGFLFIIIYISRDANPRSSLLLHTIYWSTCSSLITVVNFVVVWPRNRKKKYIKYHNST